MGLLNSLLKKRAQYVGEIKAAEKRALGEVKAAAKAEARRAKLIVQAEKNLLKAESKALKTRRRHEYRLAKNQLAQIQAGKINKKRVAQWLGAGRLLSVVAIPLAYRGVTMLREQLNKNEASKYGISTEQLATYSGYGAPLKARIAGLRKQVEAQRGGANFKHDALARLDELMQAVDNAEHMTPQLRSDAHLSISTDLNQLSQEISKR
ncbi:DUF6474 family protein [Corynebacterium caspium]|uniref:DUF6474 family protein n=1 Tax=Corynebacterium caspium TaxID=234828 RepID=UPI000374329D|nr:DUF6474 family protein [Corynebacterium caspium]WKD60007.1 hypothetical protein CCASP_08160 [Corynebacterium caspium DSM 44850]